MKVSKHFIEPVHKKENGLWIIDIDKIKIPFKVKERSVVYIPPSQIGGNHKHPRWEAFVGVGEGMELSWKENNQLKKGKMNPNDKTYLFIIPPFIEHVVKNNSKNQNGILIEFADQPQKDVQPCTVI